MGLSHLGIELVGPTAISLALYGCCLYLAGPSADAFMVNG